MSPARKTLHLASASPRRREILTGLGLEFTYAGVDIDETPKPGEDADAMVLRLAAAKAAAASAQHRASPVIIGADTSVTLDGEIFGKPADGDEAMGMLLRLSGRTHEVVTGVAVCCDGEVAASLSRTAVRFRDIDPAEARLYWQSGEPIDKAGGYAVQGLGGIFVAELDGSYSGVVGLPVFETAELLAEVGVKVLDTVKAIQR
jgi:septum formation protein